MSSIESNLMLSESPASPMPACPSSPVPQRPSFFCGWWSKGYIINFIYPVLGMLFVITERCRPCANRRAAWHITRALYAAICSVEGCALMRASSSGREAADEALAPARRRRRRARRWCAPRSARVSSWSIGDLLAGRASPLLHAVQDAATSQPVPSRHGVHWPQDSCL